MRVWQRPIAAVPLPVLFVLNAILYACGTYFLGMLVSKEERSWIACGLGGLAFGLGVTAWQALQRRRNGGAERLIDLGKAIQREQLPSGVDPEEWRPRLERQARTFRWLRIIGPVEFALFAALAAWLAVERGPIWWMFVVVFLAFGVFVLVASVRNLGRVRRLLARLDSGSPVG